MWKLLLLTVLCMTSWGSVGPSATSWGHEEDSTTLDWAEYGPYNAAWGSGEDVYRPNWQIPSTQVHRTGDGARMLDSASFSTEYRVSSFSARDFFVASEALSVVTRGERYLLEETSLILESGSFSTTPRFSYLTASETAELLDTGLVSVDSRNLYWRARELLLSRESSWRNLNVTKQSDSLLLDSASLTTDSRTTYIYSRDLLQSFETAFVNKNITISDSAALLDSSAVSEVLRGVTYSGRELVRGSETLIISTPIVVGESAFLLDSSEVSVVNRAVVQSALELVRGSEAPVRDKAVSLAESGALLDTSDVSVISRIITQGARELVNTSETASESITVLVPVASNIQAVWSAPSNPQCSWDVGDNTRSCVIQAEYDQDSNWFTIAIQNTTPNTTGYSQSHSPSGSVSEMRFRVTPYTGTSASGNAGTTITSGVVTGGGPL